MREFFEVMIDNFSKHFKETRGQDVYPNQSVDSCLAIYDLCVETKPDSVIDIGTNFGASTIALAMGLKKLGVDLSNMTTIDTSHSHWTGRTPVIQAALFKQYDLDCKKINVLTQNFGTIDPASLLSSQKNILVFYDMHDHTGPFSLKLLHEWIPLIKKGVIVLHDVTPVANDFQWRDIKDGRPRSKVKHFNGQMFAGFSECERIISWMNENKVSITVLSGIVYFTIDN